MIYLSIQRCTKKMYIDQVLQSGVNLNLSFSLDPMGIILHREAAPITLTSGIRHDAIGEVGSKVHLSHAKRPLVVV